MALSVPMLKGERPLDVICIGRIAVDLYAQQTGARLEDVASFAKYPGGSSGNIALGCARLGLKSGMLARVGNDHMGRFLRETLAREGCDVSHLRTDPQRLTALVLLGLKDRASFPLVFYREDCADMAFDDSDVDEAYIARSRALLITGTHFSTARVSQASLLALEYARRHRVRTVLDIDYRPVLWGLTDKADGETRFISSDRVSRHVQQMLPLFDMVIGTEEEFRIAGGASDLAAALSAVRALTPAILVVKRGAQGCSVIGGEAPQSLAALPLIGGVGVEVCNVLGAGDAFAAGFLSQWLRGGSLAAAARIGNACGALVVSRHACAPAMPTLDELAYFLDQLRRDPRGMRRPDRDAALARLHRVSPPRVPRDEVLGFAFDHRNQFFELAQRAGAGMARVSVLKQLFVQAVAQTESRLSLQGKVGVLIDDQYGQDALNDATGRGWWVGRPVEQPGSRPLEFERGRSVGTALVSWPREQVVKCLVQYHPDDDPEQRIEQETQLRSLYDAVQASGHELLLEVIAPQSAALSPAGDAVLRALRRLYNIGICPEWWKLAPLPGRQWRAVGQLIAERDPYCRGVVLLGLAAPLEQLARDLRTAAAAPVCRGFMVGRTIFHEPSRAWLAGEIGDDALIDRVRNSFETLIHVWRTERPGRSSGGGAARPAGVMS